MPKKVRTDPSVPPEKLTKKMREEARRAQAAERTARQETREFLARVAPRKPGIKDLPRPPRRRKHGQVKVFTPEEIAKYLETQGVDATP